MAKSTKQKARSLSIREWCKQQAGEDTSLELCWEGGGDSGWVYFLKDGENLDNKYTRALVDHMYETLDYGSWAGEFSASGRAKYNPETEAFEGIDDYSEDSDDVMISNIVVTISDNIHFDELHLTFEDEGDVTADIVINNGPSMQDPVAVETDVEESIKMQLVHAIETYSLEKEFNSVFHEERIPRSSFKKEKDSLVYVIPNLSVTYRDVEEKDVMLSVVELNRPVKD